MKRYICSLLTLILCFSGALAQQAWQNGWDEVVSFEPRVVKYLAEKDGMWSALDENGEVIYENYLDGFDGFDENGLATVRVLGKWGVMNARGEFVVPPAYAYIGNFCCGRARFEENDLRGFFDISGEAVIPAQYYRANDFLGDYAAVAVKGEKWGKGSEFDEYFPFWGVIDLNGNIIVPCEYDSVEIDLEQGIVIAISEGEETVYSLPMKDDQTQL